MTNRLFYWIYSRRYPDTQLKEHCIVFTAGHNCFEYPCEEIDRDSLIKAFKDCKIDYIVKKYNDECAKNENCVACKDQIDRIVEAADKCYLDWKGGGDGFGGNCESAPSPKPEDTQKIQQTLKPS